MDEVEGSSNEDDPLKLVQGGVVPDVGGLINSMDLFVPNENGAGSSYDAGNDDADTEDAMTSS